MKIPDFFAAFRRASENRKAVKRIKYKNLWFGYEIPEGISERISHHIWWRSILYFFALPMVVMNVLIGSADRWPEHSLSDKLLALFFILIFATNALAIFAALRGWIYSIDAKIIGYAALIVSSLGLLRLATIEHSFMTSYKEDFSTFIAESAPELRAHISNYHEVNCTAYINENGAINNRWVVHTTKYCLWLTPMRTAIFEDFSRSDWDHHIQTETILAAETLTPPLDFRKHAKPLMRNQIGIESAKTINKYEKDADQILSFWALAVALALGITKLTIELLKLDEISKKIRSQYH
jgi:hypothetical protein